MSIPQQIKDQIAAKLWAQADNINWLELNITEKSTQYKIWAEDAEIGQKLSRYMPYPSVHKYIKDSLMKPYAKSKALTETQVLEIFSIDNSPVLETYIKPFGFMLADGRIVCFGRAVDWKIVLLSTFERAAEKESLSPYGALLTGANGKFASKKFKKLAKEASEKLGIMNLIFTA